MAPTVLALSRQIYEPRDFAAMPILADALEDAGCDSDDVLNHAEVTNRTFAPAGASTWFWGSHSGLVSRAVQWPFGAMKVIRIGAIILSWARERAGQMSASLEVYLVDEAMVKAVPGSNDTELFEVLLARKGQGESLGWLDEVLDIEDRFPGFTHADALRDILAGRVTRPEIDFAYAYAFGYVCSSLGEWVGSAFHRCSGDTLRKFDTLFQAHRVDLRFWGGLIRNPPIPLPPPSDCPYVGHWLRAEALHAAPAFATFRQAGPHGEHWFEEMLDAVGNWLVLLEQQPGSMLVGVWC